MIVSKCCCYLNEANSIGCISTLYLTITLQSEKNSELNVANKIPKYGQVKFHFLDEKYLSVESLLLILRCETKVCNSSCFAIVFGQILLSDRKINQLKKINFNKNEK